MNTNLSPVPVLPALTQAEMLAQLSFSIYNHGMDDRPFFIREPKWQIVIAIVVGLLIYIFLTNRLGGAEKNEPAIALDSLLFYLGGIIVWVFFFGQFVLPVRTLHERFGVFVRLLRYLFGEHGPVTMIKNGEVLEPKGDLKDRGPGVVVLDTASAAMLRTDVAFTRPVGPGVTFTHYDPFNKSFEHVASAVDLRRQSNFLGPKTDPLEDPFAPKGKNEADAAYQERQKRRYDTSGLTRDGIEVVPNLFVSFQLDCKGGEGNTQFGYNDDVVRKALTAEAVEPGLPADDTRQRIPWNKLPGALAVDIWRETLQMFTLDDLFRDLAPGIVMPVAPPPGTPPPTALGFISSRIRQRLTQEIVDELDGTGHRTGRPVESKEFRMLQKRGIRIFASVLIKIALPQAIEDQLVSRWESTWLARAKAEQSDLERQLSTAKQDGNIEALEQFATISTRHIRSLLAGRHYPGQLVLHELLLGSLELIIRDRQLLGKAEKERQELLELISWAERNPD